MADTTTRVFSAKKDGQALFFPGLVPSRYSIISEYSERSLRPSPFHRIKRNSGVFLGGYREADIYDWEVYELGHSAVCLALADFAVGSWASNRPSWSARASVRSWERSSAVS